MTLSTDGGTEGMGGMSRGKSERLVRKKYLKGRWQNLKVKGESGVGGEV